LIDELQVYNRALSATEIQNIVNAGGNFGGQPQFLAESPMLPAGNLASLTLVQLQPAVQQAIAQLAAAGYNVGGLASAQLHIADLPGSLLGWTFDRNIWIDQNAAGYGWYIDVAASSNAGFAPVAGTNELEAIPTGPGFGHVDLLSVVTHELGHILGLSDDRGIDWMGTYLPVGTRRPPVAADPPIVTGASLALAPTSVTTTASAMPAAALRALPATAKLAVSGTAASAVPVTAGSLSAAGDMPTSSRWASPWSRDRATTKPADLIASSIDQLMNRANLLLRARVKRTLWNLFDGPIP
jgi:hypothetical protein